MVRMHGKGAGSCEAPDSSPRSRGVRAAPGAHKPLRAPEMQGAVWAGHPWPAMGPLPWHPWKGLLPTPYHSHGLCVDCPQCFALQKNTVISINIHLLFSQLICPSVHVFIHLYLSVHPSPVYTYVYLSICPSTHYLCTCVSLVHLTYVSVQFSHSVVSDCLQPHGLQHTRFPCPTPTPEVAQTHVHQVGDAIQPSHPLLFPFSSCLQFFPASGSFPMSQFFMPGGQSIEASSSTSVLPMNIQY